MFLSNYLTILWKKLSFCAVAVLLFSASFNDVSQHYVLAAVTPENASRQLIDEIAKEALGIINEKNISSKEVKLCFEDLLRRYFAMNSISNYVLGRKSIEELRKISKKSEFDKSLLTMFADTYSSRFSEYKNAKFYVTSVVKRSEGCFLVKSRMSVGDKPEINIDWQVRTVKNELKIQDALIENVSIREVKKTEIRDRIKSLGINGFISEFITKYKPSN